MLHVRSWHSYGLKLLELPEFRGPLEPLGARADVGLCWVVVSVIISERWPLPSAAVETTMKRAMSLAQSAQAVKLEPSNPLHL